MSENDLHAKLDDAKNDSQDLELLDKIHLDALRVLEEVGVKCESSDI